MKRLMIAVAAVMSVAPLAQAQFGSPTVGTVRVIVEDAHHQPVSYATVEMMDFGSFSNPGSGSKQTDTTGRVEFTVMSGTHRIHVTSTDYQSYEASFDTMPGENMHTEYVRLQLKPGVTPGPAAVVPAVRLKIPAEAHKEFEKAGDEMEKRHYEKAVEHFRAAIGLYPDYDLAYNGLGIALINLKDLRGASDALDHALQITPDFAAALRTKARILLDQHNWTEAAAALEKSLQTEPNNGWALMNAAYAELELSRFEDAVKHAELVDTVPHDGLENAHYIAAIALEQLGQADNARAQYQAYLKEAPAGPNAARAREAMRRLSASAQ